jgi:hypothetical protein
MARTPNYFFVVFGAAYSTNHPVDGGIYGHDPNYLSSSGIMAGDVMLLYCTKNYFGHSNEIPGIGVVTDVKLDGYDIKTNAKTNGIIYQYFPLCHPIDVDWDIRPMVIEEMTPIGKRNWSLKGNWLRKISSISFRSTIAGRQIDWP